MNAFQIYSDGSGFKEGIGAGAWAKDRNGQHITRKYYLGDIQTHSVFEGELVGVILALVDAI